MALVLLLEDQLGSHVGSGSEDGLKESGAVLALNGCSEPEISESNVVLGVEHDVLGLQVTMGNTLGVHEVHHLHHLFEVVTASFNAELLDSYVVEEFAAANELKSHVGN